MTRSIDDSRRRALELHLAGASYQAIADALGYAAKSRAYTLVREALADLEVPAAAAMAATEVARLDAMLQGLWPKARRGDVQAVDRVLKIEERRHQLALATAAAAAPSEPASEPRVSKLHQLRAIHGGSNS
jgi:hypothetical protein